MTMKRRDEAIESAVETAKAYDTLLAVYQDIVTREWNIRPYRQSLHEDNFARCGYIIVVLPDGSTTRLKG